jgi:beta-lactam-binding protein with PASTA domain
VLLALVLAGCGATQTVSTSHTSGPSRVAVPSLIGLTQAHAVARLRGLRLTASPVTVTSERNPGNDFRVLSQLPRAGAAVRPGTAVIIRIEHYVSPGGPTGLGGIGH